MEKKGRKLIKRTCQNCGETFHQNNHPYLRKFCNKGCDNDFRRRNRDTEEVKKLKNFARSVVYHACAAGKLTRPNNCSMCKRESGRIEAHHEDYNEPLQVVWVCRSCHDTL